MTIDTAAGAAAPARWMDYVPIDEVAGARINPKRHDEKRLASSIDTFGFADGLILDERTGRLVAGHGRLESLVARRAAGEAPPEGITVDAQGRWLVPIQRGWRSMSDGHARAFVISHNRITELGGWDDEELVAELAELDEAGLLEAASYDADELAALGEYARDSEGGSSEEGGEVEVGPNLADRFLVPPFDVLDARQGFWRTRKASWIGLGLRSELGRDGQLVLDSFSAADSQFYELKNAVSRQLGRELSTEEFLAEHYTPDPDNPAVSGSSIFDPVLTELAVRWFSPPGGDVLDPFAGGSVRGLVSAVLGRTYTGNDLSGPQVEANRAQAREFAERGLIEAEPTWTIGDSGAWVSTLPAEAFDLMLTCPPYLWLERYGDDPADLSNLTADAFEEAYTAILTGCAAALRPDRYAVVVVGDVRDQKSGALVDFRGMTIRAAAAAGLAFQSGGILVTPAGSLPFRAGRGFEAGRLLGRTHQDVLVFCKGDRKAAAAACGPVQVELPEVVADAFAPAPPAGSGPRVVGEDFTPDVTPVEVHGGYMVKRDDAWRYRGAGGAKSRTMIRLAQEANAAGIVSAGARVSPQLERAALAAEALGLPARLHTGAGKDTPELILARAAGAEVLQHAPGRLSVIRARFRDDAENLPGWLAVPYGMDHPGYVADVATQASALPYGEFARLVVPVGSGMTLAGVLAGIARAGRESPRDLRVFGVRVGGDPTERLDGYAPGWRDRVELVTSELPYEQAAPITTLGDLRLDPIYEAKCLPYLAPGDLLWCVGIRASAEA